MKVKAQRGHIGSRVLESKNQSCPNDPGRPLLHGAKEGGQLMGKFTPPVILAGRSSATLAVAGPSETFRSYNKC